MSKRRDICEPTEEGYICELGDILEEGYLCVKKGKRFVDDVIRENIEYALREGGLLKGGERVILPAGALSEFTCPEWGENGFYQNDFEVFDERGNIVFIGTAYGPTYCLLDEYKKTKDPCDIIGGIYNMTIELKRAR